LEAAAAGDADARLASLYVANDEPTRTVSGWMQREWGWFLDGSRPPWPAGELFVIGS
jgi:hypothetical protein